MRDLIAPLSERAIQNLRVGEIITLSGTIYTARDQAHVKLCAALKAGEELPFKAEGAVIFYAGPSPAPKGEVIGSIGPTTSERMDTLTEPLLAAGVLGLIGKGERSPEVVEAISNYGAVYLKAIGGIAALLQSRVVSSKVIAYPELGTEAIRELVVKDFPLEIALL